jgi:hypothetical protein
MFTEDRHKNAEKYWSQVQKKGSDECWPWKGRRGSCVSKPEGKRTFGLYYGVKQPENGYVMNQRFAYIITHTDLPPTEFDSIKVRPTDDCKLSELCCNPRHIKPSN